MFCSNCGAKLPDNSRFCPFCGSKVALPEVNPEVVQPAPQPQEVRKENVVEAKVEAPKQPERKSKYTSAQIEQFKRELPQHRRRRRNFGTAGGILLGVGILLLVIGIIVCITATQNYAYSDYSGDYYYSEYYAYLRRMSFGGSLIGLGSTGLTLGIIFLIIGPAVFGKKADNRERAIREYEEGR